MKTTTNILNVLPLRSLMMLLLLMGWMGSAWAQDTEVEKVEKVIYSTDFQDWEAALPSVPAKEVTKRTLDGRDLTFTLYNILGEPYGTHERFTHETISLGYLRAEKASVKNDSYIETSVLPSVTEIKFIQAGTGGNGKRGWRLEYQVDGESEWHTLYSTTFKSYNGEVITVTTKQDGNALELRNVKLRFNNLLPTENTYMTGLEIKGKVETGKQVTISYYDTDGTTLLGTQTVSGTDWKFQGNNVTLFGNQVFRGWYDGTQENTRKMIKEGTELLSDINLYAIATPQEEPTTGSGYSYELNKSSWLKEEHDLIEFTNGAYKNKHGWEIQAGGDFKIKVASKAVVKLTLCNTSDNGTIKVTDESGNTITSINAKVNAEGTKQSIIYEEGKPTTLTFHVSARTYVHQIEVLNFKPVYVSFAFPNNKIEGKVPEMITGDKDNQVSLPDNSLFYREGWTFEGWTDDTKLYTAKETYTFQEDVTLKPKMKENDIELTDANQAITVEWKFDHWYAPAMALTNKEEIPYTKATSVEGSNLDVRMQIDATNGKFDNTDARINALSNDAEGALVGKGTKFRIPAVYGMTVKVNASDKVDGSIKTQFGEGDNYAQIAVSEEEKEHVKFNCDSKHKYVTLTYTGDATSLEIIVQKPSTTDTEYGFFKSIQVTYPVLQSIPTANFIAPDKYEFPNETANDAGSIQVVAKVAHPNTGKRFKVGDEVIIFAQPTYGYKVTGYRIKGATENVKTTHNSENLPTITYTDPTTRQEYLATEYTITAEDKTIEAIYGHQTLYKVTTQLKLPSTSDDGSAANACQVKLSPEYKHFTKEISDNEKNVIGKEYWFTAGTKVTASAEIDGEYVVNSWKDGTTSNTDNIYEFTISENESDRTIIANIANGVTGSVTFNYTTAHVNGPTPDYQYAESMPIDPFKNVKKFTVPTNYTFFKNVDENGKATDFGYTLKYWVDQNKTRYELGKSYAFKSTQKNLTLIPHFEQNPASQLNRTNNPIIRYDFGRKVRTDYKYNPDSKEENPVCAQTVNIGSNKKFFWTSKAYVEVLEEGESRPHTRDVALWCDTGDDGFINNTQFDEWAAFGPGTTFYFTAGAGTKISILTYSPITTTTIDGVVPTLDEERTGIERAKTINADFKDHVYVYSYTTQNTAIRPKIVIGNDYSYYQWIETATLAANLMTLHADLDDENHGEIIQFGTTSKYGLKELEDGGYAIRQGDRASIDLKRKFGFELDKVVDLDKFDKDGNPLVVLQILDNGKVAMINKNSYNDMKEIDANSSDNPNETSWGNEGNAAGTETSFFLKKMEPTETDKQKGERTRYHLCFSITQNRNLRIYFKEKPTYYVTYRGGSEATGSAPTAEWLEPGEKFTIPQNRTLYRVGYTLDHWTDNVESDSKEHRYEIGTEYTMGNEDIVLHPVFKKNQFNQFDIDKDRTITWNFTQQDGAPEIVYERMNGILVSQIQLTDNKESIIDLKIDLMGENGKFNNTSYNDRMQINKGSYILFPLTADCAPEITLASSNDKPIVEGNSIKFDSSDAYAKNLKVTYKPLSQGSIPFLETLTCNGKELTADQISQLNTNGSIDLEVSPWNAETGTETPPILEGTATNDGKVSITQATLLNREATVAVSTASGIVINSYTVKFNFTAPDDEPQIQTVTIGGTEYKMPTDNASIEVWNVHQSGAIKLMFNRTMNPESTSIVADTDTSDGAGAYEKSVKGKEIIFKYWDFAPGSTHIFTLQSETDIYGKQCSTPLTITLHIMDSQAQNQHKKFDFVVGKDGDIDEAIKAANEKAKKDERFYIFVPNGEYPLTGNFDFTKVNGGEAYKENPVTQITQPNVSLIGQSKEGVVIYNEPVKAHNKYAATLHLTKDALDFYAQDLTLDNRFSYLTAGSNGQAAAIYSQANKSILKNVAIKSWQDTYYTDYATEDFRGYLEDCDIYGVMDYICGDGNIWFEKCNLIHRDRSNSNIVAAGQEKEQEWGYVFNGCTIKTETDNPQLDYNWTLGRPWNNSPACTFLNTTMLTYPKPIGWGKMETNKVIRFHEYKSMNANGDDLSLTTRGLSLCAPAAGSEECVLSEDQAQKYTQQNVLGGTDGFVPNILCHQIDAKSIWEDNIELDDDNLKWQDSPSALCYFVFKQNANTGEWEYQTNTTETSVNLSNYGSGNYYVRAANQRGGLGAPTQVIKYELTDPYELTLEAEPNMKDENGKPVGWSTICLPFNAKVPEGVTAYAATAHNHADSDKELVSDYIMTLTPVEVIDAEKGYLVSGAPGTYVFKATSFKCKHPTILKGNPEKNSIPSVNTNCYVLGNKTWGLGFYKYVGTTLAANRAWLPEDMVSDQVQESLSTGARAIRFEITDGTTGIHFPLMGIDATEGSVYNMQGQRVDKPTLPGIYIIKNKGKVVKK